MNRIRQTIQNTNTPKVNPTKSLPVTIATSRPVPRACEVSPHLLSRQADGFTLVEALPPAQCWGMFPYEGGKYEGMQIDGIPHGKGKLKFKNGETYEGSWFEGVKHGQFKYKKGRETSNPIYSFGFRKGFTESDVKASKQLYKKILSKGPEGLMTTNLTRI